MASNVTFLWLNSIIKCEMILVHLPIGVKAVALKAAVAIINIVIALFGTLANGLVIMAYCRNPRLRTIQNTIFLLLAIPDLSVTAFVEPVYVAAILYNFLGSHSCTLWDVGSLLSVLFLQLSLVTSVILSLQSYITLAYPYYHRTIITKRRLIITVVSSFLLVSSLTFSVFWRRYILAYGFAVIVSLAIITVVLTWCWTYKLVARHQRAIQTTQSPSTSQNISRRKILRSTVTALAVIFCLIICCFLILCLFFLSLKVDRDTQGTLWVTGVALVYLNSLLNPCLVLWRSTSFRETVRNFFVC